MFSITINSKNLKTRPVKYTSSGETFKNVKWYLSNPWTPSAGKVADWSNVRVCPEKGCILADTTDNNYIAKETRPEQKKSKSSEHLNESKEQVNEFSGYQIDKPVDQGSKTALTTNQTTSEIVRNLIESFKGKGNGSQPVIAIFNIVNGNLANLAG